MTTLKLIAVVSAAWIAVGFVACWLFGQLAHTDEADEDEPPKDRCHCTYPGCDAAAERPACRSKHT